MTAQIREILASLPAPIKIVYFRDDRDLRYHELPGQTPARLPISLNDSGVPINEPKLCYLEECEIYKDIEVYVTDGWVKGHRCGEPTEFRYTVSVVSFAEELAVARAVNKAIAEARNEHDSPLTWFKFSREEKA